MENENRAKKLKKTIRNLIFFIILIVITFYMVFKDQNVLDILNILHTVNPVYVLLGIMCMVFYLSCEAINIGRTLNKLNEKSNFFRNLKYAFIGFFFSGITPAASGGQPMQIYYMHKDGISVANSTLALLINLSCVQIATISLALISVFINHQYLHPAMASLFVIGILLNVSALTMLLISILSKKATNWLINTVVKILKFFRVKDIDARKKKIEDELEKYQDSATYIKQNKMIVLKTLLLTFAQFIAFYSVSYFTYRAFGFNEYNIIQLLTMQSILYGSVSGIPSPGAVGVSEGGYMSIFSNIYSEEVLSSAMLLNRGINFYLFIIISAMVVVINDIQEKKKPVEDY